MADETISVDNSSHSATITDDTVSVDNPSPPAAMSDDVVPLNNPSLAMADDSVAVNSDIGSSRRQQRRARCRRFLDTLRHLDTLSIGREEEINKYSETLYIGGAEEFIMNNGKIQANTKDDCTYHWDTKVIPFLNSEVLPNFLCGTPEENISNYRESMKHHGIEHWRKDVYGLLSARELENKWSYGVSEEVINIELSTRSWSCCTLWETDNDNDSNKEFCHDCRRRIWNPDHEKLCRDQHHDHTNLCCACHVQYHRFWDESCVLCKEKIYDKQKNCAFVAAVRCGHEFHVDCIKAFLQKKNICPICNEKALIPSMKSSLYWQSSKSKGRRTLYAKCARREL